MDQVRVFAQIVWQQRFWVLSVLATSTIVACWYLAAGNLDAQFSTQLTAISGQFNAVRAITNEADHPNNEVIDADRAQAVIQSKSVSQVWSELYERQHTEVLNWPENKVLGPRFAKQMEGRKFLDPISQNMRNLYWVFIEKEFDKLLDIVKARKSKNGPGRRFSPTAPPGQNGGNSVPNAEDDGDYLVDWLDQGSLKLQLSFSTMPTHKQIWVTQEDLWVYETLLGVIAKTNELKHATRPDNTAVRTISKLQVGSSAIISRKPPGRIYLAPTKDGPSEFTSEESLLASAEATAEGAEEPSPLANRYLDPQGEPVGEESLGTEFRQLPVHMELRMDQRFLPQLLIECANAPLPVEVKWIRINPEKARSVTRDSQRGVKSPAVSGNLSTVEIQGVVLIYGEPNKDSLSVSGAEEELEKDEKELVGASPATS